MYPMTTLDVLAEVVEQMDIDPAEGIGLLDDLMNGGDDDQPVFG